MLDAIISGVIERLHELFGDQATVSVYEPGRTFGKPCYMVGVVEQSETLMLGHRRYRENAMAIRYLPGETDLSDRELGRVSDVLMDGMEWIRLTDGSLIRGSKKSSKMSEGTLTFLISYNLYVLKEKSEEEPMEGLTMKPI